MKTKLIKTAFVGCMIAAGWCFFFADKQNPSVLDLMATVIVLIGVMGIILLGAVKLVEIVFDIDP